MGGVNLSIVTGSIQFTSFSQVETTFMTAKPFVISVLWRKIEENASYFSTQQKGHNITHKH